MLRLPLNRTKPFSQPIKISGILLLSATVIIGTSLFADQYIKKHQANAHTTPASSNSPSPSAPVSTGPDNSGPADTVNPSPGQPGDGAVTAPSTPPPSQSSEKSTNYKELFQRDLFIGDSITEGLSFYEYLDEKNVVSSMGITLYKAPTELQSIKLAQPENIFLLFGVNDIDNIMTDEKFINEYTVLIQAIQTKYPHAQIYIESILPVSSEVPKKRPYLTNTRIDELNKALIKLAGDKKVNYLNIASVLKKTDSNLYESDGIHFKAPFYPLWLDYVATQLS